MTKTKLWKNRFSLKVFSWCSKQEIPTETHNIFAKRFLSGSANGNSGNQAS